MRLEGFGKFKKYSLNSLQLEPATFRLVVKHNKLRSRKQYFAVPDIQTPDAQPVDLQNDLPAQFI
jgi:hypothetical protein